MYFLEVASALTVWNIVRLDSVLSPSTTYLYIAEKVSWEEARTRCADLGLEMATPTTPEENAKLLQYLYSQAPRSVEVWMGGYCDESDTWRWVTGPVVHWDNWQTSEPNDIQYEKCMRLKLSDTKWWNRQCSYKFFAACQRSTMREGSFSLVNRNKIPTGTPMRTSSVASALDCSLMCIKEYRCRFFSMAMASSSSRFPYLCKLFTSDLSKVRFLPQADTSLYYRQT